MVTQVSCGNQHSAVVCDDGQVFCWGNSSDGQCGVGVLDLVLAPTRVAVEIHEGFCEHGMPRPSIGVAICDISCGARHTAALSDGESYFLFNLWLPCSSCQS